MSNPIEAFDAWCKDPKRTLKSRPECYATVKHLGRVQLLAKTEAGHPIVSTPITRAGQPRIVFGPAPGELEDIGERP